MNLAELRRRMVASLSEEEVRTLAFDIGEDYQSFGGDGKEALIRELLTACSRKGKLDPLLAELRRSHPTIPWDEPLDDVLRSADPISNLPHPSRELLGRDDQIAMLSKYIEEQLAPVIVIEGPSGTGKSSLANYVANRFREKGAFRAFIWWTAEYESRTLDHLLDHIGRHLGPRADGPTAVERTKDTVLKLLAQQPTLLLVNRMTKSQHREILKFLRQVPRGSCVVITTTSLLSFGQHLRLGPLPQSASIALIRSRAEELQFEAIKGFSDAELSPLIEATDGLPDAIILAVGIAKEQRLPLDEIIQHIRNGMGPFSGLCANAYGALSEGEQEVLNLICVSKRMIEGPALEAVSGLGKQQLQESVLSTLQNSGLVHNHWGSTWATTRYAAANRIVREYYNAAIRIRDPEKDRILRGNLADYYLQHCEERGGEQWHGYQWLESNIQELFAVLDWYVETEQRPKLVRMMKAMYYFLDTCGYWREAMRYGDLARQAARIEGDRQSEAEMLVRAIGWTEFQLHMLDKAVEDIERGRRIFEEIGSESGLARATRYLGTIERRRGNAEEARILYDKAVEHAERAEPDRNRLLAGILVSLSKLGGSESAPTASKKKLREALALYRDLNHKPRIAEIYSRLADIERRAKNNDEAERLFQESERLAEGLDRPLTRAFNMLGLGLIEVRRSNLDAARSFTERSRQLFSSLGIANEIRELQKLLRLLGME